MFTQKNHTFNTSGSAPIVNDLPKLHRHDTNNTAASPNFVSSSAAAAAVSAVTSATSAVAASSTGTSVHLEYENSSGDFMKTKIKRKTTLSSNHSAGVVVTPTPTVGGNANTPSSSTSSSTSTVPNSNIADSSQPQQSQTQVMMMVVPPSQQPPPPPSVSSSSSNAPTTSSSGGGKSSHKERSSKRRSGRCGSSAPASNVNSTATSAGNPVGGSSIGLPLTVSLPESLSHSGAANTPSPNAHNANSGGSGGAASGGGVGIGGLFHNGLTGATFRSKCAASSAHSPLKEEPGEDPYEFKDTTSNTISGRLSHNFECSVPSKRQKMEPPDTYDMITNNGAMLLDGNDLHSVHSVTSSGRHVTHTGVNTHAVNKETMTEEECFGPCSPGTEINLNAIVWLESSGILVLNIPWRGRNYIGTLLDCTKHSFAPTNFYTYQAPYETRVSGGRGRGKRRSYGLNGRICRGGMKGRSCSTRNQLTHPNKSSGHNSGAEESAGDDEYNNTHFAHHRLLSLRNGLGGLGRASVSDLSLSDNNRCVSPSSTSALSSHSLSTTTTNPNTTVGKDGHLLARSSSPLDDDVAIYSCNWNDCQYRYTKYTALRYHQTQMHSNASSKQHHHHHHHSSGSGGGGTHNNNNASPHSPVSPSIRGVGKGGSGAMALGAVPGSSKCISSTNANPTTNSPSARPRKSPKQKKHHERNSSLVGVCPPLPGVLATTAVSNDTSNNDVHNAVTGHHDVVHSTAAAALLDSLKVVNNNNPFVSPLVPPAVTSSKGGTNSNVFFGSNTNSMNNSNHQSTGGAVTSSSSSVMMASVNTRTVIAPTVTVPIEPTSSTLLSTSSTGMASISSSALHLPGVMRKSTLSSNLNASACASGSNNSVVSLSNSHNIPGTSGTARLHLPSSNMVPGTHICPPIHSNSNNNTGSIHLKSIQPRPLLDPTGGSGVGVSPARYNHPTSSSSVSAGGHVGVLDKKRRTSPLSSGGCYPTLPDDTPPPPMVPRANSRSPPVTQYYSDISDADSPAPILEKEEDFKSPNDRNNSHLSQPPPALVPAVAANGPTSFESASSGVGNSSGGGSGCAPGSTVGSGSLPSGAYAGGSLPLNLSGHGAGHHHSGHHHAHPPQPQHHHLLHGHPAQQQQPQLQHHPHHNNSSIIMDNQALKSHIASFCEASQHAGNSNAAASSSPANPGAGGMLIVGGSSGGGNNNNHPGGPSTVASQHNTMLKFTTTPGNKHLNLLSAAAANSSTSSSSSVPPATAASSASFVNVQQQQQQQSPFFHSPHSIAAAAAVAAHKLVANDPQQQLLPLALQQPSMLNSPLNIQTGSYVLSPNVSNSSQLSMPHMATMYQPK